MKSEFLAVVVTAVHSKTNRIALHFLVIYCVLWTSSAHAGWGVYISPAAQKYLGYSYYGPFPNRQAAQSWVNAYCPRISGVSISGSDDAPAKPSQSEIQATERASEKARLQANEELQRQLRAQEATRRAEEAAEAARLFRQAHGEALNLLKDPSPSGNANLKLRNDDNPVLHLKEIPGSDAGLALKTLPETTPKPHSPISSKSFPSDPPPEYLLSLQSSLDQIHVPPPITQGQAVIGFHKLEEDPESDAIFLGTDSGIAVVEVMGEVSGIKFSPFELLVVTGKAFVAAENAADVYIVKENEVYEQALAYLKNKETRATFAKLVGVVRKHDGTVSENVSIKMLAAAQAIADPTLNDPSHKWNDALWALQSPAARQAALTRIIIEGGGMLVSKALFKPVFVDGIHGAQAPAFEEANAILEKAQRALKNTASPDGQAFLRGLINRANAIIGSAYRTEIPKALLNKAYTNIFTDWAGSHLPE